MTSRRVQENVLWHNKCTALLLSIRCDCPVWIIGFNGSILGRYHWNLRMLWMHCLFMIRSCVLMLCVKLLYLSHCSKLRALLCCVSVCLSVLTFVVYMFCDCIASRPGGPCVKPVCDVIMRRYFKWFHRPAQRRQGVTNNPYQNDIITIEFKKQRISKSSFLLNV